MVLVFTVVKQHRVSMAKTDVIRELNKNGVIKAITFSVQFMLDKFNVVKIPNKHFVIT